MPLMGAEGGVEAEGTGCRAVLAGDGDARAAVMVLPPSWGQEGPSLPSTRLAEGERHWRWLSLDSGHQKQYCKAARHS